MLFTVSKPNRYLNYEFLSLFFGHFQFHHHFFKLYFEAVECASTLLQRALFSAQPDLLCLGVLALGVRRHAVQEEVLVVHVYHVRHALSARVELLPLVLHVA